MSQRYDGVFRQVADRKGVGFDRVETGLLSRTNALHHPIEFVAAGDLLEGGCVQCVQTNVDSPESGVVQRPSLVGQQDPIRCQTDVANLGDRSELGDKDMQIAAHQRLPARQTDLVDAQRDRHAHEPFDLFEGQQFLAIHELHLTSRHAVKTADVAAVGDTDAQVVMNSAKGIDQCRRF